jgi:hypothetical protein
MEETNNQYQQTLDYLYSFVDYSLQHIFRYSPEKFNLERMREFVKMLGAMRQRTASRGVHRGSIYQPTSG